jgi:RNA polymerase sigma-70 factor, ECF subfamily
VQLIKRKQAATDEELVRRSRQDDQDAFAALVDRYQDKIYNLAYRMTGNREEAEDVAQETFLHTYRALDTFRLEERFSPWIYKIASNLCLDRLRKQRHPVVSLDEPVGPDGDMPQQVADWSNSPDRVYETTEIREDTQEAISSLPPKYKMVVVLRHVQDLSYDEIANILGIPQGTVKTRLFRAREILRRKLSQLYDHKAADQEGATSEM